MSGCFLVVRGMGADRVFFSFFFSLFVYLAFGFYAGLNVVAFVMIFFLVPGACFVLVYRFFFSLTRRCMM